MNTHTSRFDVFHRVVCRELGLEGITHVNRAPERFGIKLYADNDLRTKRILLTDVRCDGTEATIFECLYFNETIACDHDEDAGVICRHPTVKAVEQTPRKVKVDQAGDAKDASKQGTVVDWVATG